MTSGTVMTEHQDVAVMPGIRRMWDPRVWGTFICLVLGSTFTFANRALLPDPWSSVAMAAWLLVFIAYLWATLLLPRAFPDPGPLPRKAGLVYLVSVAVMIAVIQLSGLFLRNVGLPELLVAVTMMAVGLHFFPFAGAFREPFFTRIGIVVTAFGALALVLGLAWTLTATAALAVVNGIVMVALLTHYAYGMRARG